MKPERLRRLLLAAWLAAPLGLAAAKPAVFDAPTGLTLQAREGGRFQLLWDPIYRDDLMGYSIWLRRPGEAEFTRLSVPVKVGKEIRKVPLTNEARLILSLGAARRDVEVTVVAEYENGSSVRAPSAFTSRAKGAAAAPSPAAGAAAAPSPGPSPSPSPVAKADADELKAGEPGREDLPQERPLLTPFKAWRSELRLGFDYLRSIRKGSDIFSDLGLLGTDIPASRQVNWERVDVRTIFSVPLTLRYGILPGFEVWAQGSYHAEDVNLAKYVIDGENFDYIVPIRVVDGKIVYLPNPSSTGFGDTYVGVNVLPLEQLPLVLGAAGSIPTGLSRFHAYLDWDSGRSFPAGTGEGVSRLQFSADYGRFGRERGLSFHGAYSPGVSERFKAGFMGIDYPFDQVVTYGDRLELSGAFTLPWKVGRLGGALMPGLCFRTLSPTRWTVNNLDAIQFFSPLEQARLTAHTQQRFVRDDQMEIVLEALQDLPNGFSAGGRLAYTSGVQGDGLHLSGQFYY